MASAATANPVPSSNRCDATTAAHLGLARGGVRHADEADPADRAMRYAATGARKPRRASACNYTIEPMSQRAVEVFSRMPHAMLRHHPPGRADRGCLPERDPQGDAVSTRSKPLSSMSPRHAAWCRADGGALETTDADWSSASASTCNPCAATAADRRTYLCLAEIRPGGVAKEAGAPLVPTGR